MKFKRFYFEGNEFVSIFNSGNRAIFDPPSWYPHGFWKVKRKNFCFSSENSSVQAAAIPVDYREVVHYAKATHL